MCSKTSSSFREVGSYVKYAMLPQFFGKKSRITYKHWLLIFVCLSVISFCIFNQLISIQIRGWIRIPPKVSFYCLTLKPDRLSTFTQSLTLKKLKVTKFTSDSKILFLVESQYSKLSRQVIDVFDALRFKYKIEVSSRVFLLLNNFKKGKFSVIVFENLQKYFRMGHRNRDIINNYCREFNVGIIGFETISTQINASVNDLNNSDQIFKKQHLGNYPVTLRKVSLLKDYQLNSLSNVLKITRSGTIALGLLPGEDWSVFEWPFHQKTSFIPIAQALPSNFIVDTYPGGYRYSTFHKKNTSIQFNRSSEFYKDYCKNLLTTVLQDNGSVDGIQKVLFGNNLSFWLNKLIFIDALTYLSNGHLALPLERYLQIDIDDIFVGERGTRMKSGDVEALINFQDNLQTVIPDFKFNLGFSGKYFHRGFPEENEGDDLIIQNSELFRWFCHMFSHSQAHLTNNLTFIENEMLLNREFAKTNKLSVESDYIVSPHHSGVFPIHEPLYEAWKKIWKVRVSSTEEYPHLRPAHLRRGFIHNSIMVLPRQTCALYTHTIFIDKYPGGREKLESNIFGGDLFFSFVFNQVNVFMTHQSNYANDRLAIYTFDSVFKFLQCWTNLKFYSLTPLKTAKKYFTIYPEDKDPLWMNPCDDRRHYNIWSPNKTCLKLPKFLILGPQKTGSTALYTFLKMHTDLLSNAFSNQTFEEIQFFNDVNYYKGIDWYMSFFSSNFTQANSSLIQHNQLKNLLRSPPDYQNYPPPYFFEKSSTYFDGQSVPRRVHALLPHSKLIIILIDPIRRAYSWYQHMRAHNYSLAMNFTFHQVISSSYSSTANKTIIAKLQSFRNRCLHPGLYAVHLERWLSFFPAPQIMIVDGDQLRSNPVSVMDKVQTFLKLESHIDFRKKLRFDSKKGFYCTVLEDNHSIKCLGKSKGRVYPSMDEKSARYLHQYYFPHNIALHKLLSKFRLSIPFWLNTELQTINSHQFL